MKFSHPLIRTSEFGSTEVFASISEINEWGDQTSIYVLLNLGVAVHAADWC